MPPLPYSHVLDDCGAAYSAIAPLAERLKARNCSVLLSINWPTTVPSSLTRCTWLRVYPGGAENVSKVQEACSAACIPTACKNSVTMRAGTKREKFMKSSIRICLLALHSSCARQQFQNAYNLRIGGSQRRVHDRAARRAPVSGRGRG